MFTGMFVFVTLIIWTKQLETCFFPGIYIYITVLTKFMFNNARTHRENKINLLYNVHVLIIIVTRWEKISFNHPCVCRLELSNPRCLTVSVNSPEPRLQTTVRQPGLESLLLHTVTVWLKLYLTHLFHLTYFNYRTNIALCCSQYYRVNIVRINFTIFTI